MTRPTLEQQRYLVKLWDKVGPELERIRLEALRDMPHNPRDIDELLRMTDNYTGPPRLTSGLQEWQRIAMKTRPGQ